jgi:protoporphyrinogen/coproporphyrinogen III oxidase
LELENLAVAERRRSVASLTIKEFGEGDQDHVRRPANDIDKGDYFLMPRAAIVGAGLSGLTAAWRLRQAGWDVQIFDKAGRAGGRTMSIRQDGFVFDVGAITLLPTYKNTIALAHELGIENHLHPITPVIGIPRGGVVHRLDLAKPIASLLGTKLISLSAKFKLLKLLGPLLRSWKLANFQSLTPLAPWDGETIASYVRRECGDEVLNYIAGPIIRGNTLNSTDCAPFGELLWMLRQYAAPNLYGFDQGINFLAETLAERLPVKFDTTITSVSKTDAGVILHSSNAGDNGTPFDACVIGLPPPELLALAPTMAPAQRGFLQAIEPLPSISLHVGLRVRPPMTETFILPPVHEQPWLTTIVMDHLKAPGRAPEGKGVITFFLSDDWARANYDRTDAEIKADILAMARPFVGDIAGDIESWVVQRWPYAIIKSGVGLYHHMRDYESAIDPADPVQIAGDFLSMGMEAAVSSGIAAADRIIGNAAIHQSDKTGE